MGFLEVFGEELSSTKEDDGFDVEDEGAVKRRWGREEKSAKVGKEER